MEFLEINGAINSDLLNSISSLGNIELQINLKEFKRNRAIDVLANVKSLAIINESNSPSLNYSDFDGKFTEVKHLHVAKFGTFKPLHTYQLLESFKIENSVMKGPLLAPKIKEIIYDSVTFQTLRMPLEFNSSAIESITLNKCYYDAWCYLFLQHTQAKLNSFTLVTKRSRYIADNTRWERMINDNKHKVKMLSITYYRNDA